MKAPGILLAVGGIIVLLLGLVVVALGSVIAVGGLGIPGVAIGVLGGVQVIFGILLILSGVWHEGKPAWRWVGLVISLLSLISGGGLIVGPFIANIGAAAAMKSHASRGK